MRELLNLQEHFGYLHDLQYYLWLQVKINKKFLNCHEGKVLFINFILYIVQCMQILVGQALRNSDSAK